MFRFRLFPGCFFDVAQQFGCGVGQTTWPVA